MATGSYLSIITLNINGLNAPTKRQRLADLKLICKSEAQIRGSLCRGFNFNTAMDFPLHQLGPLCVNLFRGFFLSAGGVGWLPVPPSGVISE